MEPRIAAVLIVHAALFAIGCRLVAVDMRTHRLPDRIVLPTLAGVIVLITLDAAVTRASDSLTRALIGMLLLAGFYAALRLGGRDGMGGGDVKLAAVIGAVLGWHGWSALAVGAASAFVLGALFALALMALGRADARTRIAFGPWMIIGAVLGVLIG